MNNTKLLQQKIIDLKKQNNFCVISHSYQAREICEVADYVGDSFQLSLFALNAPQENILMCGVRFMAETAKILSQNKRVFLANNEAGCPMAEQMDKEYILREKAKYDDCVVVAYINTTADLKTVCDVCVTSSTAVNIVKKLPNKNILFIPDCNLGAFVAQQVPDKNIILLDGGCPIHAAVEESDAVNSKNAHPSALLLVHPECKKEVVRQADFCGSTSEIMNFAKTSKHKEFIIGTELSILTHLQYDCSDKKFYPLSKKLICNDMKLTTLYDVYNCLNGEGGSEIILQQDIITKAKKCIDEMIKLG